MLTPVQCQYHRSLFGLFWGDFLKNFNFFQVFTNRVPTWPQFNASTIDHYLDSFSLKNYHFSGFQHLSTNLTPVQCQYHGPTFGGIFEKLLGFTTTYWREEKFNFRLFLRQNGRIFQVLRKMYQVKSTSMPAPTVLGFTHWREEKLQF